jgi:RND family efflux transporter MFP subunit
MFRPVLIGAVIAYAALTFAWAQQDGRAWIDRPAAAGSPAGVGATADDEKIQDEMASKVEQVVIHPFMSANIAAEVTGVLKAVHFEEGDRVENNAVVAEIRKDREAAAAQKALERFNIVQLELKKAEIDLEIKNDLVRLGGGVRQELEKARTVVEIAKRKIKDAEEDVKIADLNLKACEIRAPFAGHVAVRYKQAHEAVEKLEKVFSLVDSTRVFAVANVPEPFLPRFKKGSPAVFVHTSGKKFKGKVDRLTKLVDPKSMTKRVYVLIDNQNGELEIGTTGTLESAD